MSFDPNSFMQMEVTDANATKYISVPAGEWPARIVDVKGRVVKNADGNESPVVDVFYGITDPKVVELTGMDEPRVRQSLFLDMNPSGGLAVGEGKNVKLGKLRDVLGQNQAGVRWNFDMLRGGIVKVKVSHSPNPKDAENPYVNVDAVSKL
jgi:hypothetical protein